ncbi:Kelch domain-containing protein 10 [Thelohanellus kitauei]|uniref:Kelch domain-containing protein 10 n=1 Tax=Thelohanellus kitauei TaxID=669202 RepID=A0A0C2MA13_THEKT|nr:Kelch domain-containing protein 10 [Thelohanellus kitauei]
MASVGEYLIIFAQVGYASTGEFSKLWSYNTITGVWSRHKKPIEIKFSRLPHWICKLGDLVYMFGGQIVGCRNYREYITSVVSFDITHDKWSTVYTRADNYGDDDDGDDDDDDPPEMELSLLFYHCGSLYIQGKIDEYENLCGMYKFCLETSKWSLVPQNGQTPRFKYIVHGTVYNNQLYCFGKRRGVTNGFREIPIFDFTTNTWTTRATIAKNQQYPDDRAAASYTFWENFAYMSGGIVGDSRSVSDIWRMDLETLEWLKLDVSLQTGEYHHLMSVVDDCYLYSFGANGQGLDFFDKFERFTLRPPSLYLLSLETVCRSPNMSSLISSLPSDIVDKHKLNDNNSS